MGKLFGTDGIRGVANQYPMTVQTAVKIGQAVGCYFGKGHPCSNIIIGRDPRVSSPMITHALAAGICSMGMEPCLAGIIPTPAVAALIPAEKALAGIMVSASHNPYEDNGIKIFDGQGNKLTDQVEAELETLILDEKIELYTQNIKKCGTVNDVRDADEKYIRFLKNQFPRGFSLQGLRVVLDCANGATFYIAPKIFKELGAEVTSLFNSPDGFNINENCGSQHTETVAEEVVKEGASIGLAFDGDGDRLIAVDETGRKVAGDEIMAICGKFMKKEGTLKNNLVVSTVMSNLGLRLALKELNIDHIMAKVGDRYVLEEMIRHDAVIGGEDSGHLIFRDHHTTGDGILAALKLLQAMTIESKPLSHLASIMNRLPQKLVNVKISRKPDIESVPELKSAIDRAEKELGETGRVLVRYSGTQPMCRVMVEAPTTEETEKYCLKIVDKVKQTLA